MSPRARTLLVHAYVAAAAAVAACAAYLVSMPLRPVAGDSHGGLLAVFSALLRAPVALAAFAAGRLFQRGSPRGWPMQVLALGLVAAAVAAVLFTVSGAPRVA